MQRWTDGTTGDRGAGLQEVRYAGGRVGGLLRRVRHLSGLERQRRGRSPAPARRRPRVGPVSRSGSPPDSGRPPIAASSSRRAQDAKPDGCWRPSPRSSRPRSPSRPAHPRRSRSTSKNDSTIVESYTIHAADPPPWLTVTHGEANLLPGVLRTVPVTFSITPGVLAVAQRVTVPLVVRSGVDATRPRRSPSRSSCPGPGRRPTLVAQPNLIRLEDASEGTFRLRLDNRAANFGRQYVLPGPTPRASYASTSCRPRSTYRPAAPPRRPCASPRRRRRRARSCRGSSS